MLIPSEEGKLNFLIGIFATYAEFLTGGIMAMHKLANVLAQKGHNVYIFCQPEYPHENIKVIPSKTIWKDGFLENYIWDGFSFPYDRTISIYPQIFRGNPFNTQHVCRWILYHSEWHVEKDFDENDVYFTFEDFKTFVKKEYRELTVYNYNFDKLYKTNFGERKSFCHIVHKHTPPGGLDIFNHLKSEDLTNWKKSGAYDYLREKFNQHKYFLTYDQKSFYTVAAGLCGTQSIILNPGPPYEFADNADTESKEYFETLTPMEYRLRNKIQMFGVAYGWNDLTWAEKTIHLVPDYIKELEKINDKTVDMFIDFWKKRTNV